MSYSLLFSDDISVFPTVMSRSDARFCEMIMAGYKSVYDGTRQQCEVEQERRIASLVSSMDADFWAIG